MSPLFSFFKKPPLNTKEESDLDGKEKKRLRE
jgi:hypothetical protein